MKKEPVITNALDGWTFEMSGTDTGISISALELPKNIETALRNTIQENADMLELLIMALPYVEEGEEFNKPRLKGKDSQRIRDMINQKEGN